MARVGCLNPHRSSCKTPNRGPKIITISQPANSDNGCYQWTGVVPGFASAQQVKYGVVAIIDMPLS